MNRRLLETALLSLAFVPLACGDDDVGPQETETTTEVGTTTTTTTTPDPGTTTAETTVGDTTAGETTAAETTEGETTAAETTAGETTAAETTEGETTGGGETVLQNTSEPCMTLDYVYPYLPEEAGHWAATTLTPTAYPFEVQRVVYDMIGDDGVGAKMEQCNSTLAHSVAVFVSDVAQPDASPSANAATYQLYPVAEDLAATGTRTIDIELDTPIVLEDGQLLIVAIEMVAVEDQSLCLDSCFDTGGLPQVDWWSNATGEPFPWVDMAVFMFGSNFTTRAIGTPQ